jgi:hypothetical protein
MMCDIIFLSDIRLGEIKGTGGDFKIKNGFLHNKYRSYKAYTVPTQLLKRGGWGC